jgi:excinuclease UvrABC nuclease subunit
MRGPCVAAPAEIDAVPDRPAVFLLWAASGAPYLARTALLRRRLKRLLPDRERVSRLPNLSGVIDRIEYWLTGSQLQSALVHLELAQRHFPQDWPRIARFKPPVFLRLLLENPFPRTIITTRFGRGLYYGPFPSRAAAERFESEMLDLFQLRRCEENLAPSPDHPGCMYGEMNKCLRPCQQAVSPQEYASEAARVGQFLRTGGALLAAEAEAARERASTALDFETAERLHQRSLRIAAVRASAGDLAREVTRLHGVAVVPSAETGAVDLWFLAGGRWLDPRPVMLADPSAAARSLDSRVREIAAGLAPAGPPHPEHLAILLRWHGSSWRQGEWIPLEDLERLPYRRLVNAIGRVAAASQLGPRY